MYMDVCVTLHLVHLVLFELFLFTLYIYGIHYTYIKIFYWTLNIWYISSINYLYSKRIGIKNHRIIYNCLLNVNKRILMLQKRSRKYFSTIGVHSAILIDWLPRRSGRSASLWRVCWSSPSPGSPSTRRAMPSPWSTPTTWRTSPQGTRRPHSVQFDRGHIYWYFLCVKMYHTIHMRRSFTVKNIIRHRMLNFSKTTFRRRVILTNLVWN